MSILLSNILVFGDKKIFPPVAPKFLFMYQEVTKHSRHLSAQS